MSVLQRTGYLQRLPYLSRLYSDTKQSYETANVTSSPTNVSEEPEVGALRRDFQVQKDRLLAWGLEWTESNAVEAQHHGQHDIEIDEKLGQAGVGEIVANILAEIQRLLHESGKLHHPERYLESKPSRNAPTVVKKEWTLHEVATNRTLLDQLTTCIDVLYSLSESRRTQSPDRSKKEDSHHLPVTPNRDKELPTIPVVEDNQLSAIKARQAFLKDSFYIPYDTLDLKDGPTLFSSDPPPYEFATLATQTKCVGTLKPSGLPILVDFTQSTEGEDLFDMIKLDAVHHLADVLRKCSDDTLLSYNGHWPLLGITTDEPKRRVGSVYQLPRAAFQGKAELSSMRSRSLGSVIAEDHGRSEIPSPPLEDKFRLAYNLVLSVLGYMTNQMCHRYINSSNVLLLTQNVQSTSRSSRDIRSPYLIPSTQSFTRSTGEALASAIYRHPLDDIGQHDPADPSHDIYSIGLLLWEIGMWMPLSKLWKSKYNRTLFMQRVRHLYTRNLASKCGTRYMHLVEKCLDAPGEFVRASDATESSKMMRDAVEYLVRIAADLAKCCTLDEYDAPPTSDRGHVLQQLRDSPRRLDYSGLPPKKNAMTVEEAARDAESAETATVAADHKFTTTEQQKQVSRKMRSSPSRKQGALRKWPDLRIPQLDLDQWNTSLMPRLSSLLQNALSGSAESSSVSLMMIGPTSDTAKTTICIQCSDTQRIQEAITQKFKPKRGWGVVVHQGKVRRSGRRKKSKKTPGKGTRGATLKDIKSPEQLYQEQPANGASIGAYRDCEHLPPVSYGGIILVDGEPFGMTVHHMLDSPSEDDEEEEIGEAVHRSAAPAKDVENTRKGDLGFMQPDAPYLPSSDELEISEEEYSEDEDSDTSTIRPDYAAFDSDGNEFWFLDDVPRRTPELSHDDGSDLDTASDPEDVDDPDDNASIGDRGGINPWDKDELYVTQPAIDDIDRDFFPNDDDRDEDHLASHSFGYIHASSGIRRVVSNDVKHEIDWALIRVHDERRRLSNAIQDDLKGKKRAGVPTTDNPAHAQQPHDSSEIILEHIASCPSLSGTEVFCCGRSSGCRTGRISQAMALVKMYGRQSFSSSWCVEGGFGVPGDSGAWVYNPTTRELCGHVLAWGNKSKTAYIAPMDVLFDDIRDTLGAETVCLPSRGGTASKRCMKKAPLPKRQSQDIAVALQGLRIEEQEVLGNVQLSREMMSPSRSRDLRASARRNKTTKQTEVAGVVS